MAKTAFATGDAQTKKLWEEKLFRDSIKESYFSKLMSSNGKSVVHVTRDLQKNQGDKVTFTIRMRLTGSGVTSGQILEGNEEALTTYTSSVSLEQYRHAVRDKGALDRQRPAFSIDEESEQAIRDWGTEKVDKLCFDAITASPTKVFYKTGASTFLANSAATAKAALNASNSLLTPNFISFIKAWAKTGGNRQYVPIRPVMVDGESYYVLLVHPDCMYDLKVDSTFQQAQREAQARGKDNPLFKNATAIWDGVVIHEHENIPVAADGGGTTVPWASCVFLGAQALTLGFGKTPEVIEEEFDYKNEHGYAIDFLMGVSKPVFNSLDYGSLGVYLARTNVSGV